MYFVYVHGYHETPKVFTTFSEAGAYAWEKAKRKSIFSHPVRIFFSKSAGEKDTAPLSDKVLVQEIEGALTGGGR